MSWGKNWLLLSDHREYAVDDHGTMWKSYGREWDFAGVLPLTWLIIGRPCSR